MLTKIVFDTHGGILDEAPNFPSNSHFLCATVHQFFFACPGQVFLNKLHRTQEGNSESVSLDYLAVTASHRKTNSLSGVLTSS
jgi:hypothetical protein